MTKIDHDLLIVISTDIKYIKESVGQHGKSIGWLKSENQKRRDWQEDWNSKAKFLVGIATFVGGFVVFIGNKLWDLFVTKRL